LGLKVVKSPTIALNKFNQFFSMKTYLLLSVSLFFCLLLSCKKDSSPENSTMSIPVRPYITNPLPNAQLNNCLVITWQSVAHAESYTLSLASDSLFSNNGSLIQQVTIPAHTCCSHTININQTNTLYLRLYASNTLGKSALSPIIKVFTNIGNDACEQQFPLVSPQLISPQNNILLPNGIQTFLWSDINQAHAYHLQIANDTLFNNTLYNNHTIYTNTRTIQGFSIDTSYDWRVKALSSTSDFSSAWSVVYIFYTK